MAASKSDTAFLTLTKSFSYRGQREQFANVYHWDQVPPDTNSWSALLDAVWALERNFFTSDTQLEAATGHNPGEPPQLVWETDPAPPGTGGPAGAFTPIATDHNAPGDAAVWIRYGTTQKTSRGKPIYLRNYYHDIYSEVDGDTLSARQATPLAAIGAAMLAGFNVGGVTYRRAGPRGAVAQNQSHSTFITTRTLKRRGKRKKELVVAGGASDAPVIIPGWFGKILSEIP